MKKNLIISTITGLILAFFMMYLAWEHNTQYEIHDGETIYFGYWITLGISWFILTFLVVFIFMSIAKKIPT
jgi:uncharacterized membrane protein